VSRLETSFANGAQLSYSYVAPLAGPGVLPKIPPWLLRRDSPLRFYPRLDSHQWHWLLDFVLACNAKQSDLTTRRLLALSFYSRRLMADLQSRESIEFGHARNGKLVVHSDPKGFEAAGRLSNISARSGAGSRRCRGTNASRWSPRSRSRHRNFRSGWSAASTRRARKQGTVTGFAWGWSTGWSTSA